MTAVRRDIGVRVFIEPGSYSCLNMGDLAMLHATVNRINSFITDPELHIITHSPALLTALYPGAKPIDSLGRQMWVGHSIIPSRIRRVLGVAQPKRWERSLRHSRPGLWEILLRAKFSLKKMNHQPLDDFLRAIQQADLFIVSGAGGINDSFSNHAHTVLDILEMGQRRGIPTLIFGQGFGPITKPELLERAAAVLPQVDFIAIREERFSLPLLSSLGVNVNKVITTGDDAIEIAYTQRHQRLGNGLGVNLRLSSYAAINTDRVPLIRNILHKAARSYRVPLLPIPISHNNASHDPSSIRELLKGVDDSGDGGESLRTVEQVIEQVSQCRVVVTGSYHAGVFALSQGIPVAAIANTLYYQNKFIGLQDQFGKGCEVILLKDVVEQLEPTIDRLWKSAEDIRPSLLSSAARQIEASKAAYRQALSSVIG